MVRVWEWLKGLLKLYSPMLHWNRRGSPYMNIDEGIGILEKQEETLQFTHF
jgi:hypothetical protein